MPLPPEAYTIGADTNLDPERYKSELPSLPASAIPDTGPATPRPQGASAPAPNPLAGGQVTANDQIRSLLGTPLNLPTEPRPTGNPLIDVRDKVSNATGGLVFPRAQAEQARRLEQDRRHTLEERKLQIETLKTWSELGRHEFEVTKSTIGAMADFLRNKPDATDEEIAAARQQFVALGTRGGAPGSSLNDMLGLMGRQRKLAEVAGLALPWIDDAGELGKSVSVLKGMAASGSTEDDNVNAVYRRVGSAVMRDTLTAVREVTGALRKSGKADKDGTVDPLAVLDQVEARGAKGPLMASVLRGDIEVYAKNRPQLMSWLETAGMKNPETIAAATRERETTRARTEAGPVDMNSPVNKKLVGAGIDPRKIDPGNPDHAAAVKLADQLVKAEGVQQVAAESQARAQGALNVETSQQAIQGAANKAGAVARAEGPTRIAVAEATGKAAMELKIKSEAEKPVSAKDRASYIDVNALKKDGTLRQPPPGTTYGNIDKLPGYAYIDDKQKERLTALTQARGVIDQIDAMSSRVITQKEWSAALAEGGQRAVEARLKSDPEAATFHDTREAFVGNLSRVLGAERGVLTDRDINRMGSALPNFGDTTRIREAKIGMIRDIWTTNQTAVVGEVTGVETAQARSKVDDLLNKLEGISPQTKADSQKAAEQRLLDKAGLKRR